MKSSPSTFAFVQIKLRLQKTNFLSQGRHDGLKQAPSTHLHSTSVSFPPVELPEAPEHLRGGHLLCAPPALALFPERSAHVDAFRTVPVSNLLGWGTGTGVCSQRHAGGRHSTPTDTCLQRPRNERTRTDPSSIEGPETTRDRKWTTFRGANGSCLQKKNVSDVGVVIKYLCTKEQSNTTKCFCDFNIALKSHSNHLLRYFLSVSFYI